jgi:hypothetical protein
MTTFNETTIFHDDEQGLKINMKTLMYSHG